MVHYPRSFSSLLFVLGLIAASAAPAFAQPPAASGPFNVRTYGASGTGNCAADTAGFTGAFLSVPPSGGEVYIPAGTYCMTGLIGVYNNSISIRGEGQGQSIIRFVGSGDGIQFIPTTSVVKPTLTIKSLTIVGDKASISGSAAIRGIFPPFASGAYWEPTASITDVQIEDANGHSWAYGIKLTNGGRSSITNFNIDGPGSDTGANSVAIRFDGQSILTTISGGEITFWDDGIQFTDNSEGLHVTDVEIVATRRGVVLDGSGGPGTSIANSHMNTRERGIETFTHGDIAVSNNLMYSTPNATSYIGIHAVNVGKMRITGNYIEKLGVGAFNGIVLEGNSFLNVISNNTTNGMSTGIWLLSGTNQNLVFGNLNRNFTFLPTLDQGTGNTIANNY